VVEEEDEEQEEAEAVVVEEYDLGHIRYLYACSGAPRRLAHPS
jgi:hypothetical protein